MTLDELTSLEEIKQLKYRYVRAIDTHDWVLMATCFTEDAVFTPDDGKYSQRGRDAIVSFFGQLIGPTFISSHFVGHPEILLTSPSTAAARWRLEDIVHFMGANAAVKGADVTGEQELRGAAYYYDEYTRQRDGWKISSLTFVRIFKSVEDHRTHALQVTPHPSLGVKADWQ